VTPFVLCYNDADGKRPADVLRNAGARAAVVLLERGVRSTAMNADNHTDQHPPWAAQVEQSCLSKGLQLTPLRRQVLAILADAPAPLGAYAIIEELARGQRKAIAPPTVYRTLDFFLDHGFLHKIESRNVYAPCEHLGHDHHGILLICERCGRTDEIESPRFDKLLRDTAASAGFAARRQVVEVEGLCETCGHEATPAEA
jgi:Fur family transcriptional regulator, zinc uptake regulator